MATGAHATALQLPLWSVRLWFVLSNSTGMCSLWRDHAIDHRLSSNKSVFSLVNLAVNMILPASASGRRAAAPLMPGAGAAAVDQYALPARRSAANPPHAAAAEFNDGTDRRTDRQTDVRPFHRLRPACYVRSVSDQSACSSLSISHHEANSWSGSSGNSYRCCSSRSDDDQLATTTCPRNIRPHLRTRSRSDSAFCANIAYSISRHLFVAPPPRTYYKPPRHYVSDLSVCAYVRACVSK